MGDGDRAGQKGYKIGLGHVEGGLKGFMGVELALDGKFQTSGRINRFFFRLYLFIFIEKGRERERKGEKL